MADTTQPAGALPEPAGYIRLPGVPGLCCDGYTADQMRVLMAERDAAREERDIEQAFRAKHLKERDSLAAQVKQLAGAHVAWLAERDELRRELALIASKRELEAGRVDALVNENAALRRELRLLQIQLKIKPARMADCPVYCKTAVDLQAELDSLRATAANVVKARDDFGWSSDTDAAINALRGTPPDAREGREPLTDAAIGDWVLPGKVREKGDYACLLWAIRETERLHGIGTQP